MHQGRLGLSDWFVVSDPIWTTGKNYLSHIAWLSIVSQPRPLCLAWLTGLGSFTGQGWGGAEKQEERRNSRLHLAGSVFLSIRPGWL